MDTTEDFRDRETVRINYDEFATDDDVFVDEGRYVPDDMLPFAIDNSAGTRFDIDGTTCELLGDLGGHAVYRRQRHPSTIRAMDWEMFAKEYHRDRITILTQH